MFFVVLEHGWNHVDSGKLGVACVTVAVGRKQSLITLSHKIQVTGLMLVVFILKVWCTIKETSLTKSSPLCTISIRSNKFVLHHMGLIEKNGEVGLPVWTSKS